MRILVTGLSGQLGRALRKTLTAVGHQIIDHVPLVPPAFDVSKHDVVPLITDLGPDLVIHAAAMTNVDGAAKDPDLAFSINAFGTQNVAHGCLRCNADLVYISTNEVFDGTAEYPYRESDTARPINPYGSSKRAGEQMAANYVRDKLYIVRTAWLYSTTGNNFPAKIIAAADKHGELRVVTDEISNPTYAPDLAEAITKLIKTRAYDTYHFTNSGHCSRYDFAKEILRRSGRADIPVHPITLADYPRASTVPPFTALQNTNGPQVDITLRSWEEGLAAYFEATANA